MIFLVSQKIPALVSACRRAPGRDLDERKTTMRVPTVSLTRAMVTGPIVFEEAPEWRDGKPTGKQKKNEQGLPVWTVDGLAPEIFFNGQAHLGVGERVQVATAVPSRVDEEPGTWIPVQGVWKATKIDFGEMSGRADLDRIGGED